MTPTVKQEIHALIDTPLGNAESLGSFHETAKRFVTDARFHTAKLIGASPENIVFVGSGSEANVTVIRSALRNARKHTIIVSEIEHSATITLAQQLETEGVLVRMIPTKADGTADVDSLPELIDDSVAIVSLQAVNNETGVLQPIDEARRIAQDHGVAFHTDAAQAIGKMPFLVNDIGADFVTFTGHKFHAPSGVGAIYSRNGWGPFKPLITGGSQEHGIRGGTHNLIGIVGMGVAARERRESLSDALSYMRGLRDRFEAELLGNVEGCVINGDPERRVCNTSNLQFKDIDGKALFAQLLHEDIMCSQSSACTSQYPEPSRVLRAMGLGYHEAFSSIRFSFGVLNTEEEVTRAVEFVADRVKRIQTLLGGKR